MTALCDVQRCPRCADVLSMISLLRRLPSLEYVDLQGCSNSSSEREVNPLIATSIWEYWQAPAGTLKGMLLECAHSA